MHYATWSLALLFKKIRQVYHRNLVVADLKENEGSIIVIGSIIIPSGLVVDFNAKNPTKTASSRME